MPPRRETPKPTDRLNACAEFVAELSCHFESAAAQALAWRPSASGFEKSEMPAPPVRESAACFLNAEIERHQPAENYAARRVRYSGHCRSPPPAVRS